MKNAHLRYQADRNKESKLQLIQSRQTLKTKHFTPSVVWLFYVCISYQAIVSETYWRPSISSLYIMRGSVIVCIAELITLS